MSVDGSPYPEHGKIESKETELHLLRDFCNWLEQRGIDFCELVETGLSVKWVETTPTTEQLIHEYCEIDLDRIEEERRLMLHVIREKAATT